MVDKKRIGAIIQVRYDSVRFPGKVLKPLPFGSDHTIVSQIVDRLKKVEKIDEIIIATSIESSDDIIESYALRNGFNVFRGDKNNVLKRIIEAAKKFHIYTVVRLTGDNPIVLTEIMKRAINQHFEDNVEYTRNNGLPYGTGFEIVNTQTLNTIYNVKHTKEDEEHVTLFIKRHRSEFDILEIDHDYKNVPYRLTVDYASDYALLNILFQYLATKKFSYTLVDIIRFLEKNERLSEINIDNIQKNNFNTIDEEINASISILEKYGYVKAANILSTYINTIQ